MHLFELELSIFFSRNQLLIFIMLGVHDFL